MSEESVPLKFETAIDTANALERAAASAANATLPVGAQHHLYAKGNAHFRDSLNVFRDRIVKFASDVLPEITHEKIKRPRIAQGTPKPTAPSPPPYADPLPATHHTPPRPAHPTGLSSSQPPPAMHRSARVTHFTTRRSSPPPTSFSTASASRSRAARRPPRGIRSPASAPPPRPRPRSLSRPRRNLHRPRMRSRGRRTRSWCRWTTGEGPSRTDRGAPTRRWKTWRTRFRTTRASARRIHP